MSADTEFLQGALGVSPRSTPNGQQGKPAAPRPIARSTHVIDGNKVIPVALHIVRGIGVTLWIASWFGSYVAFTGGWPDEGGVPVNALMLAVSLAYQLVLSLLQWGSSLLAMTNRRWWGLYCLTLAFSVVPSMFTYYGWAGSMLDAAIGINYAGGVVVFFAALAADCLPEIILLKRGGGR